MKYLTLVLLFMVGCANNNNEVISTPPCPAPIVCPAIPIPPRPTPATDQTQHIVILQKHIEILENTMHTYNAWAQETNKLNYPNGVTPLMRQPRMTRPIAEDSVDGKRKLAKFVCTGDECKQIRRKKGY